MMAIRYFRKLKRIKSWSNDYKNKYLYYIAKLTSYAYDDCANMVLKLEKAGATKCSVYIDKGIGAFVSEFDEYVVVGFRGLDISNKNEILKALQFWANAAMPVDTHSGFLEMLNAVIKKILLDLDEVPDGKKIIYSGHSMGAVLALILSIYRKPNEVCTFGCPRINGKEFRNMLRHVKIYRVIISNDWIANLPFQIIGFKHVGTPIILKRYPGFLKPHRLKSYINSLLRYYDK